MAELRLCSIAGGAWLESLRPDVELAKATPPKFGLMFGRAVESRLKSFGTGADLRAASVEGLVVALEGIEFDEELLVSAIHAIACAAVVDTTGKADNADVLEAFVRGKRTLSDVPDCLREAGVVSCMTADRARQFGEWIEAVDRQVLADEVTAMHGNHALETYLGVIDDLKGTLKTATTIHGCDVCVWRKS